MPEIRKKQRSVYLGILPIVILVNVALFLRVQILCIRRYKYPFLIFEEDFYISTFRILLPLLIAVLGLILWKAIKNQILVKIIIFALIIISIPISLFNAFLYVMGSSYCSQTEDINQYLKVDDYVLIHDYTFIPTSIPESAGDIEYFYRYRYTFTREVDIYVKWSLPERLYQEVKEELLNDYQNSSIVCDSIEETEIRMEYDANFVNDFKVIILNDSEMSIMYSLSFASNNLDHKIVPYYAIKSEEQ